MDAISAGNSYLEDIVRQYLAQPADELMGEIVNESKSLVHYFTRMYGANLDSDVYQAAYEGLIKAVKRYNPAKGIAFSTYAGHCILGEIRHYIRKESSYYSPGCIKDLRYRVEKEIQTSLKQTGKLPDTKELAQKFNVQKESISECMRAGMVSLEEMDLSRIASQHYETFRLPIEDRIILEQAMNKLSEIQRKVIHLLFFRDMTQQQASERLGIHQRKVSRLLHSSLQRLRKLLADN